MKIQSINPSTGKLIKEFTAHSAKDIAVMVAKAKIAQSKWEATTLKEKRPLFVKLQKLVKEQEEQIVKLMREETGKRKPDGYAEIEDVIDAIDYYFDEIRKIKNLDIKLNEASFPNTKFQVKYMPQGVVGLIMPWNFPFFVPMMNIIPALYTGNSVILKSSEYSTLISLKIIELLEISGFPKALVQLVIGADEAGKALVKSAIEKIFIVGSIETGKDIIKNFGIKPIHAELGGNSSAIVLEDADLDLAVNAIVWGSTYNAGQDCVGIKRCFVQKNISKHFINQIVEKVKSLRAGIDYGPYIRKEALIEIENRVKLATNEGAKLLCGCERIDKKGFEGYWLTPSVVFHKSDNHKLVKIETFGNVLPITVFEDENELLTRVNNTEYGLSNAIFTKDTKYANNLADKIESGMVFINDAFVTARGWDFWTGWKNSGIENSESRLMHFLKKKVVTTNKPTNKRAFWFPY